MTNGAGNQSGRPSYSPVTGLDGIPDTITDKTRKIDSYVPGSFGSNSQHPAQAHLKQIQDAMVPTSGYDPNEQFPASQVPGNIPDQFTD